MIIFDCVICSELLTNDDDIYGTRCGHIFHRQCLGEWLQKSETCPHCRAQTYQNEIQKLYFNDSAGHAENIRQIKDENQDLTNTIDTLRLNVAGDKTIIEELKTEIQQLKSEMEDLQVNLAESETSHAQIVTELYKTQQEFEDASVIHNSIKDEQDREKKFFQSEIAILQSTNTHLKQQVQHFESDLKKEREDSTARVAKLMEEKQMLLLQVDDLSKEKFSLMEKIVKYTDKITCLQENIHDSQQGMSELQERITFLDTENARFLKNIEIVKTEKMQLFEKTKELEEERSTFYSSLQKIEKQNTELADKVKRLEEDKQKIDNISATRELENSGESFVEEAESMPEDQMVRPEQNDSAGNESEEESLIQFEVDAEEATPRELTPKNLRSDIPKELIGSISDFELITPSSCESNSAASDSSVIIVESSPETKDCLDT